MSLGVFNIQIQGVALHERPRKIQHRSPLEGVATRMDKHLSWHEFIQIAPVLRLTHPLQIDRYRSGYFRLLAQSHQETHGSTPHFRFGLGMVYQ